MHKCIIRCVGKFDELLTALATLQAVYGKDATLEEIATATRYGRMKTVVRKQFEKGDRL